MSGGGEGPAFRLRELLATIKTRACYPPARWSLLPCARASTFGRGLSSQAASVSVQDRRGLALMHLEANAGVGKWPRGEPHPVSASRVSPGSFFAESYSASDRGPGVTSAVEKVQVCSGFKALSLTFLAKCLNPMSESFPLSLPMPRWRCKDTGSDGH